MSRLKNELGIRYGMLVVIARAGREAYPKAQAKWRCRCDCGNITIVRGANLRQRNTTSCGCVKGDVSSRFAAIRRAGLPITPERMKL